MKLPCEECPVLAICRHKPLIACNILYNAVGFSHEAIFKRAKVVLPNLLGIQQGDTVVSSSEPHYRTLKQWTHGL